MVWTDQRAREVDTNMFKSVSSDGGSTWSTPVRLDSADDGFDPDSGVRSNQWQPEIATSDGRVCGAWQDDRSGDADIRFAS